VDDQRWMTGDGSQETDHGRRLTINLLSDMNLRSNNRARICRHTMYRRHGSTKYDTEHYSGHYSEIPNYAATCESFNANTIPNQIPSHSYNVDTAQAVRDLSLAERRSLKRGMTVPELQQPLPRTITVPEVQERSTVKCIHHQRSDGKHTYR
jgi:hypothetical protein